MTEKTINIAVLGAGESGTGAAVLAKKKGFRVFVSDKGSVKEKYRDLLATHKIPLEEGGHSEGRILEATEVIKSPGIPDNTPLILKLKKKNIPVISEIEFAARYTRAQKICITGSNGKTTTSNLIYYLMNKAGIKVALAGNVGKSFALQVAEEADPDYYVLELSSFQLDGMVDFRADIALLLNITPDHLDRYGYELQHYINSKFRVIQNQRPENMLIYCADDPILTEELRKRSPKLTLLPFSIKHSERMIAFVKDNQLNIYYKNQELTMSLQELALKGKHNIYNSMAAGIASQVLHIRKEIIRDCLTDFQGVEHRLEPVIKVHGMLFINDSKATNVNSTWYALESMSENVVLILGGVDKGNDYTDLIPLVQQKVKALICLGKDNGKILKEFGEVVPLISEAHSMEEAVLKAYRYGKKGYTILLSPACASFDLFENYEDRGRQFKEAVRNL